MTTVARRSAAGRVRRVGRAAPSDALRDLVDTGYAVWHRCDGVGVHPEHEQWHREGFWTEGSRVIAFIETLCVYPDAAEAAAEEGSTEDLEPVRLLPWQREAIFELFMLRHDGQRRFKRALIGLPKKNGKTPFAGWIMLYLLFDSRVRSGFIPCAAASEDQADLVFDVCKVTCDSSPKLRELTGGEGPSAQRFESEILVPSLPGKRLRRVAVGGGTLDGKRIIAAAFDELHEWSTPKSRATYTVLNRGMIWNEQRLALSITTAGYDPDSLEGMLYEHGKAVESGETEDPTFYFLWYEAPELASGAYEGQGPYERAAGEPLDWRSREAFVEANPSCVERPENEGRGTVTYDIYLEDLNDPDLSEAKARRYHLNQHTGAEEIWTPAPWSAFKLPDWEPDPRNEHIVGLDASQTVDSTAIAHWEILERGDGVHVRAKSRVWERPIDPRTMRPLEGWSVPFTEVRAHLLSLHYGTAWPDGETEWCRGGTCICCDEPFEALGLKRIGADPARLPLFIEQIEGDGLPIVAIPQTDTRMVPGFSAWLRLLAEQRYGHDGNPALARHVANSIAKPARSGDRRLARGSQSRRRPNDAAIASVICGTMLAGRLEDEPGGFSFYFGGEDDE